MGAYEVPSMGVRGTHCWGYDIWAEMDFETEMWLCQAVKKGREMADRRNVSSKA